MPQQYHQQAAEDKTNLSKPSSYQRHCHCYHLSQQKYGMYLQISYYSKIVTKNKFVKQ